MLYTVNLGADPKADVPLDGRLVGDILETLDAGTRKVLRLSAEGRSDISGVYPRTLAAGAGFTVDSVARHPSRIVLNAPSLGDVLVDKNVRREVRLDTSAIGLFAEGMRDAIEGREASELVDESLISTYLELGRVLERKHVGSLSLTNGKLNAVPVSLRPEYLKAISEYQVEKPVARTVRVAGRINTIRHSDKGFTLMLESGHALRGVFPSDTGTELRKFYGKTVIASGLVEFRSSGRPFMLHAKDIVAATAAEAALWASEPAPLEGTGSNAIRTKKQGPRTGLNAVFGKWPIDVSDEDFLRLSEGDL
jgi:hypothetical protein